MAKHTPDWKVDAGDLCIGNQIIASGRDFGPDRATLEEKKANVRLAAAAPELLSALKQLLSADDALADEGDAQSMGSAIKAAHAAIAKAEGQDK